MAHSSSSVFQALRIAVLTVSDSRTLETDSSGQTLIDALQQAGHQLAERALVSDDIWQIRARLCSWIADPQVQVVLVTGGTGFTARDNTPQAVSPLLEKSVDGFGELFRQLSLQEIGTSTVQSRALAGAFDCEQGHGLLCGAHELLAADDGAVAGHGEVANAVLLIGQALMGEQLAVTLQQHQAGIHGVEVHCLATVGFGADTAVGDHQGFAVVLPEQLMWPHAMAAVLANTLQATLGETVAADHPATGLGGVILAAVQPLTRAMEHRMALEVSLGGAVQGLQQTAVARVDQVAGATGTATDEQRQGQVRMNGDVMTAFGNRRGELAAPVLAIANGVMATLAVVAG